MLFFICVVISGRRWGVIQGGVVMAAVICLLRAGIFASVLLRGFAKFRRCDFFHFFMVFWVSPARENAAERQCSLAAFFVYLSFFHSMALLVS